MELFSAPRVVSERVRDSSTLREEVDSVQEASNTSGGRSAFLVTLSTAFSEEASRE